MSVLSQLDCYDNCIAAGGWDAVCSPGCGWSGGGEGGTLAGNQVIPTPGSPGPGGAPYSGDTPTAWPGGTLNRACYDASIAAGDTPAVAAALCTYLSPLGTADPDPCANIGPPAVWVCRATGGKPLATPQLPTLPQFQGTLALLIGAGVVALLLLRRF